MQNGYPDEKLAIENELEIRNNVNTLNALLKAANVKRYHTVLTIGDQNIGHHSHRVCLILRFLLGGSVPSYLYEAALFHDLAESVTGDIPATTKWCIPELAEQIDRIEIDWEQEHGIRSTNLTIAESFLLIIADKLELVAYCTEQMMLGNQNMKVIRAIGSNYCAERAHTLREYYGVDVIELVDEFIERCHDECK